jgi:hypothetical protein
MAAAAAGGAGAPAFEFTPEKAAEVEQLNGAGQFEPVPGTTYYPLVASWWDAFQARCGGNESAFVPTEIDNSDLVAEHNPKVLKRGLVR